MWAKLLPQAPEGVKRPWIIRYDADQTIYLDDGTQAKSGQHQRGFKTRKAAMDFKAEVEFKSREGTFIDPKRASISFADYARTVVASMAIASGTRELYTGLLDSWIAPWAGTRTLQQVASDRAGATELVNRTMAGPKGLLSYTRRGCCRAVLIAVVDEAVAAGKLGSHRLGGIKLAHSDVITERRDFVFPFHKEIRLLAEQCGLVVWLMRGCGLRISEALAVYREDFRDNGATLRVSGQANRDGTRKVPLKSRKPGEFRDVPVPAYLWAMIEDLPDGPLCPGARVAELGRRDRNRDATMFATYDMTYNRFTAAAKQIGIEAGFTPHSLRHAFASDLLHRGIPITTVADYLGHRSITVTFRVYSHLIPNAAGQARAALDDAYDAWSSEM